MVANAYLDGTYPELYDGIDWSEEGLRRLFRQFSFPGGIPSHAAPETPGSIHEGGELGYSLSHAFGAVFDNPGLLAACVIGDGEAETGPLATAWHSNKFLDPGGDGVVLPILHLNGYKIANPTVLARIPESELLELMRGYGYTPHVVAGGFDGEDPRAVHARMAAELDAVLDEIATIKADAGRVRSRPAWPMIVLRTPKGWTCPPEIDGHPAENNWRAHQVPLANARDTEEHTRLLESWLRSYRPEELFDEDGRPQREHRRARPAGGTADERQPFRERRDPARGPAAPRLPGVRGRRARARRDGRGVDARARHLAAGRHPRQPGELQVVRPGRGGLQPAPGGLRGHRASSGTPSCGRSTRRTTTSPVAAG